VSDVEAKVISVTLTRALVVLSDGIVQSILPLAASIESEIVFQAKPSLVEYSILTLVTSVLIHSILLLVAARHFSPPFGEVTISLGV